MRLMRVMQSMALRRTSSISSLYMSTRKSSDSVAKRGDDSASWHSESSAALRTSAHQQVRFHQRFTTVSKDSRGWGWEALN